ncbi:MAG: ribonuclease [Clostridia bacterium]|nr:ribonuclease [Clostridia bacterium]
MKIRVLSLLLAVVAILSLTACNFSDLFSEIEKELPGISTEEVKPDNSATVPETDPAEPENTLPEDGEYDSRDEVALYLHLYGRLPSNYITKKEAEKLGWSGGGLDRYAPGKSIGGSRFGNYEGLLPEAPGREYYECDIGTRGKSSRGAKRLVYSNDGLIWYTEDHYESFVLLYGDEGS